MMNLERLAAAGIDYEDGLKRFSNNRDTYEKVLQLILSDTNFADLEQALAAKDAQAAFAAAHALTGIAGNLSLNRLYTDLLPLVKILREKILDGTDELIIPVRASYGDAIAAIRGE